MDVTQLPFNRLIGLESSAADSGLLVSLPDGPQYTNHLGTVHAAALLAVAEAGSGAFLARRLGGETGLVPVVRRLESKFRRPATGPGVGAGGGWPRRRSPGGRRSWRRGAGSRPRCRSRWWTQAGMVVLSAMVEWFISRGGPDA